MKGISLLVLSSLAGVFSVHDNIVPNSYIVELKPTGKHKRDSTSDAHSDFYNSINVSGIQIQSRHNFTSDLFHGTSFKIEDKHKADIIREFPHVVRMWHVKRYSQPKPVKVELVNSPNEVPKKDRFGPHIMTGVNKLHDHGVLGDGVFVAVVDTGIDYTHPALGGCFGSGCLVFTGRDLVGDKYTGDNDPVPGNDILDCGGHGTHVSGILAANDKSFTGVSPKVRLGGWKVFGCKGTTQSDILIQAFQEAADAGADIISASVGGPSGWSEDAWAVVASRLVDRGVFVSIAAGNDGSEGAYYGSTGACGDGVTAVGSVDSDMLFSWPAQVGGAGNLTVLPYLQIKPFEITGTFPIFVASRNSSKVDDGCDPLPENTPDLSKYIVLVGRGTCPFTQKAENFKAKGANKLIYYNNECQILYPEVDTLPTAMITAKDGASLLKAMKNGTNTVTLTFVTNPQPLDIHDTQSGGKMSVFSTWGPTFETYNQPHISAPGGNIFSTYPLKKGGYAVLSGTSMATPYLAGVAALYLSYHGRTSISARDLRDVMSTNGIPLNFNDGMTTSNYLAPTIQQGGGLVNALNVVYQTTRIHPGFIHLNDTARFTGSVDISIWNLGDSGVKYTFGSQPAVTVYALGNDSVDLQAFPLELINAPAQVSVYPKSIWVDPRDHGIITVSIQEPKNLDHTRVPVYSGFVQVLASNSEEFHIPYMGVAQDMSKAQVLDRDGYPDVSRSSNDIVSIKDDEVFTLDKDDKPIVWWRNILGTALLDIKLVPITNDSSDHLLSKRGDVIATSKSKRGKSIHGFPQRYLSRDGFGDRSNIIFEGKYNNENTVPNGRYKFLLKALKIMGDPTQEASYETWLSRSFYITRNSTSSKTKSEE